MVGDSGSQRPKRSCRYFSTPGGCRNGNDCSFAHDLAADPPKVLPPYSPRAQAPDPPTGRGSPGGGNNNKALRVADRRNATPRDHKRSDSKGRRIFLVDGNSFELFVERVFGSRDEIGPQQIQDPYPIYLEDISAEHGSNIIDPIMIPRITASQFRHYLVMISGPSSDAEHEAFTSDYKDPKKHTRSLLLRYLDIGILARRFGQFKLEKWAIKILHILLTQSTGTLVDGRWDKSQVLQLNSFASKTTLEQPAVTFSQYLISVSIKGSFITVDAFFDRRACIQLYTSPFLPKKNPVLFGCIFASILSLGHQSSAWEDLGQEARKVLYVAQVQLTNVSSELESVQWLQYPETKMPSLGSICTYCRKFWDQNFGQSEELTSDGALRGVGFLAQLPQHRQKLVAEWEKYRANPAPTKERRFWSIKNDRPSSCKRGGCSMDELLGDIDKNIGNVYRELTDKYKRLSADT